jgi:2-polyprenyl-6-methoxyphenol hydroxylase-like FAD-dependent oxidoreductase
VSIQREQIVEGTKSLLTFDRVTTKPKVLIIGSGIGGLTAAIALRQAGFQVEVFERASELREIGAGIGLSPNAMRVLGPLGLTQGQSHARRHDSSDQSWAS